MAINGSVSEDDVDQDDDSVDDSVDATRPRAQTGGVTPPKGGRRLLPLIAIAVVVVVALVVAGVVLSSGSSKPKPKSSAKPPTAGFTTFRDPSAGFELSYPSSWVVTPASQSNVALLVTFNNNPLDDLFVRVIPIPATVDPSNVSDIKAFTDAVISGTGVTVLQNEPATVGGLPAYYYLYTLPKDPVTGVTLVHSHFFVFPPHEMVEVLFQTASTDFSASAHTFDQVLASFKTTSPTTGSATPSATP